jgi:hypothetical protein
MDDLALVMANATCRDEKISQKYLHHKRAEISVNTTEHSSKGPSALGTSLTYYSKEPDATSSSTLTV